MDNKYTLVATFTTCTTVLSLLGGGKNTIQLGATNNTIPLHRMFAIFHGDLMSVLHFPLLFALYTIGGICHSTKPFLFLNLTIRFGYEFVLFRPERINTVYHTADRAEAFHIKSIRAHVKT